MQTILTIKEQNEFIKTNYSKVNIEHKWSCRGYGNSKILDTCDNILTKASGCGYDRFGTVIGDLIQLLFPVELLKLAKRECKGKRNSTRKTSKVFYGLFYDSKNNRAYTDGGCGIECMKRILNKIGFELNYINETKGSVTGSQFYQINVISKHVRKYFN